jgi:hypothetical protein
MKAFPLLFLLMLMECAAPLPEEKQHVAPEPKWDGLMVTWNNVSISLDTLRDTLSLFEPEKGASDPTKGRYEAVFVTQEVQDSIWMVARRLMYVPTIREEELTDYAGDYVRVKFHGGGLGTMQSWSTDPKMDGPKTETLVACVH